MQGVVLQTYGHGNWPTALTDLMLILKEACDNGIIIVNTTQCSRGTVLPIYAVGKELQEIGVIAGHDMTVEAALMKLSYILSKDEWSLKEKREVCIHYGLGKKHAMHYLHIIVIVVVVLYCYYYYYY